MEQKSCLQHCWSRILLIWPYNRTVWQRHLAHKI